ncbi:hypothetical protein COOONC_23201 [Cooperia oncophora]
MALVASCMVDAAIRCKEKDAYILEQILRHLSLHEHEADQKAKLRSVIRLARFGAEHDHLASLKIITTVKKLVSSLHKNDQVSLSCERSHLVWQEQSKAGTEQSVWPEQYA